MMLTRTNTCEIESVDNVRVLGSLLWATALVLCPLDYVGSISDGVFGMRTLSHRLWHFGDWGYTIAQIIRDHVVR